jgi:hypothetical protein
MMPENQYEAKSINQTLPNPIAFNCWKHHLGYVRDIFLNQSNYTSSETFIREVIQFIGESQFDFYKGTLDVHAVSNEVIIFLESINALNMVDYKLFIQSDGKDYKCISLSDGSNWTLRLGQSEDRYVHIHPSRHSKKTIRVKSSTLKTVYAFLFYYRLNNDEISVEKVNFVRTRFAKLPPLKPASALIAISRTISFFNT